MLKSKVTFDFGKLANQIPKIIEKHMRRTGRSSAEGAKENISKGLAPPLKKSTIEIRKKRKTGGTKPLFETGNLHKNIKSTKDGLEMNKYGIYHHKGFKTSSISMIPNKKVPARPFIFPSEKTILKSFDAFRKDLRKALKR